MIVDSSFSYLSVPTELWSYFEHSNIAKFHVCAPPLKLNLVEKHHASLLHGTFSLWFFLSKFP